MTHTDYHSGIKKFIKGSLYNTEDATLVQTWQNEFYRNDLGFEWGQLYKKNDEWFLVGDKTFIAINIQDEYSSGNIIALLTKRNVLDWLQFRCITPSDYFLSELDKIPI